MRIAVIGCGFVGSTVANFLEKNGSNDGIEIVRIDPKIEGAPTIEEVNDLDAAILCLNAPTNEFNSKVEVGLTRLYVDTIQAQFGNIPVMIKSTMPMFTDFKNIGNEWANHVVYNPEFLTAANAEEDFANQQLFVLGIDPSVITHDSPAEENKDARFWTNIFAPSLPNTEFIYTDRETAIMVKYTHNAWLATKITFFHSLSQLMPGVSNYEEMTDILAKFPNIGPSHMKVPNAIGGLGYEGFCFPKDMKALEGITQSTLLDAIIHENHLLATTQKPKNNIESSLQKKIPKNDFIIVLGTSHTFGECNGVRIPSYVKTLQSHIDMDIVEVGNSGARNIDLIATLTELNDLGFLNERCKLVLVEPRVKDPVISTSIDTIIGAKQMRKLLVAENNRTINLCRTSLGFDDDSYGKPIKWPVTTRESIGIKSGPGNLHNAKERLDGRLGLSAHTDADKKQLVKDIWEKNDAFGGDNSVNEWLTSATHEITTTAEGMLNLLNDLTLIESMAAIVKNKGIGFKWFVMDDRDEEINMLQFLNSKTSDIFKDRLLSKSIQRSMLDLLPHKEPQQFHEAYKHLLCDCGHYSETGNQYIANNIIGPAVSKTLNKISRREK